jgi:23S rRNA (guanosine2251-2'-O)-methyltransferase
MPLIFNKNNILEAIREHPESVRRLWVEGGHESACDECIKEARKHGLAFKVLPSQAFTGRFKGAKTHLCLERDEISYGDPDLFLAEVGRKEVDLFCAFDGIFDPQNLGNIIRSAACLGIRAIIIPKDRSCAITETVVTVSRGAIEHVKIIRVVNLSRYLDDVKKKGVFCYGLDEEGTLPLWTLDLSGPVCLVFGSEDGLRRLTREKCDGIVKIPTAEKFPSLNVATCFAVSAYEVLRQRWRAPK